MNKSVTTLIAAYNEEKTIGSVIDSIKPYCNRIIVVDDGSQDKTHKIANEHGAIVLQHAINLGQGAALQTGFDYIKKHPTYITITYDADGQFLARDIPKMVIPILKNKCQISLGSRFLGSAINLPFSRLIVLKLGIFFTWIFSGIKLTDTHNGFRAFRIDALEKIEIHQNRMAHASEILDQIASQKLSYIEIPVHVIYTNNRKGQSNISSIRILKDLLLEKFS